MRVPHQMGSPCWGTRSSRALAHLSEFRGASAARRLLKRSAEVRYLAHSGSVERSETRVPIQMLNSGQARSQHRRGHGFREVFVASGFQSTFPIGFLPITRHGDDPGRLKTSFLSQPSGDFIAIEMWEADVQKHNVGSLFVGCRQCGESIVDFHDVMTLEREESGDHLGRIQIVINNENAQRGTRSLDVVHMRNRCKGRIVFEHRKADDKLPPVP